jgi:large subunit ribosomal protein L10
MHRSDKERVVSQLAERLRSTETLMVADYRGLTMPQIEELRTRLLEAGARFTVVKNTLTRRAVEEAGTREVLELIDGPTAIAFLEADGDPVAVAKVLSETARAHDVLVIRGGLLEGSLVGDDAIKQLATLPPADVLRAQLVGAVSAPLATVVGLFAAPLRDLVGVLDARIRQLQESEPQAEEPAEEEEPQAEAPAEEKPQAEAPAEEASEEQSEEPSAEAEPASAESEESEQEEASGDED